MKIRNQWIADNNGDTLYMTLREWVEQLELTPAYDYMLKTNMKGKAATVYNRGGYAIKFEDFGEHMDEIFFVSNADLDIMSINRKYW